MMSITIKDETEQSVPREFVGGGKKLPLEANDAYITGRVVRLTEVLYGLFSAVLAWFVVFLTVSIVIIFL